MINKNEINKKNQNYDQKNKNKESQEEKNEGKILKIKENIMLWIYK